MKNKPVKIIVVLSSVVLVCLLAFLVFRSVAVRRCNRFWLYPYRYRECSSTKLFSDLKNVYDIDFPEDIKDVNTAHTQGCLDSSFSSYVVKFRADPNTVNAFLETLPMRTDHDGQYSAAKDKRRSHRRYPPPEWFWSEPIQDGKIGDVHERAIMNIYISMDDDSNYTVYINGSYPRDSNEFEW